MVCFRRGRRQNFLEKSERGNLRCIEIVQVLTPIFSYSGKKGNEKKNERGYNNGTTVQLGSIEVVISAKSKCM